MRKIDIVIVILSLCGLMLTGCPVKDPVSEARANLVEVFTDADANHDGALTFSEALAGYGGLDLDTFNVLDTNGDGVLTDAELAGGEQEGGVEGTGEGEGVPPCAIQLSAAHVESDAAGGAFQVAITSDCPWEALSSAEWLTLDNASGSGQGILALRVAVNTGVARSATITVNEAQLTVSQEQGCSYSVAFNETAFAAAGGTIEAIVTTGEGCPWAVGAFVDWLTLLAPASGTGSATLQFQAEANDGLAREATIEIAGQRFAVSQEDGCSVAFEQDQILVPAAGDTIRTGVTAAGGCEWTAVSDSEWLVIVDQVIGGGDGWIDVSVALSQDPAREGHIAVGNAILTFSQSSGCDVSVGPSYSSIPAEGLTGQLIIFTASQTCSWTAVSSVPWITLLSSASGQGPGEILYSVEQNPGPARLGTINVSGSVFTLAQARTCNVAISPENVTFENGQGFGALDVAVEEYCPWTVYANGDNVALEQSIFVRYDSKTVLYQVKPGNLGGDSILVKDKALEIARGDVPEEDNGLSMEFSNPQFYMGVFMGTLRMHIQADSIYGSPEYGARDLILTARMPDGWSYHPTSLASPQPDSVVTDLPDNTVAFYWKEPAVTDFDFWFSVTPAGDAGDNATLDCSLSARYGAAVRSIQREIALERTFDNGDVAVNISFPPPGVFVPGAKLDILTTIEGQGTVYNLCLHEALPTGWIFIAITNGKELFQEPEISGRIVRFLATDPITLPASFTFRAIVDGSTPSKAWLLSQAVYKDNGNYSHNTGEDTFEVDDGRQFMHAADVPGSCPFQDGFPQIFSLAWPLFDRDGDNALSLWEANLIFPRLDVIESLYSTIDTNADEQLTWDEVQAASGLYPLAMLLIDPDGDLMIHFYEVADFLTPSEFVTLDKDGNRVLDCNDLP